jgi:hypothetical protein
VREGPLYRVGARERSRSWWELGRQLLMGPFRVGEEMGEGEVEGEGRGWGGGTFSGGVEGRGRRAGGRWPEVSRVVACWPMAGGDLGYLTRGGRGTTGLSGPSWAERLSGPGALGRPISEKK